MPMRSYRLPDDFVPLAEMIGETWQYPENPEWSVQPDEEESIADSMKNYSRLWPLVRVVQKISPSLRDILHGYVWEEDGQIVGFADVNRQGTTDTWYISGVGVRPGYRRRGIAQKLVKAVVDFIRERGGKSVLLDMIDGNVPAYRLYEKMGFEHYSGSLEYLASPEAMPPEPNLPPRYVQASSDFFDWQPRYELELRATPETVQRYDPVEEGRFRRSLSTRLLWPLLLRADGLQVSYCLIKTAEEGQVVAHARYAARVRKTGRSTIAVFMDPAHPELAPYLVGHLLRQVKALSPGRQVEFSIPEWMAALVPTAEAVGFERRVAHYRMGLIL